MSFSQHLILQGIVFVSLLIGTHSLALKQRWTVQCPEWNNVQSGLPTMGDTDTGTKTSNNMMMGYTSLETLNAELRQHASQVTMITALSSSGGGSAGTGTAFDSGYKPPLSSSTWKTLELPPYVVCPGTLLNTTDEPLWIPSTLLPFQPTVQCGSRIDDDDDDDDSNSTPNESEKTEPPCRFDGGLVHLWISNRPFHDSKQIIVTIEGFVFSKSTQVSMMIVPILSIDESTFYVDSSSDTMSLKKPNNLHVNCIDCHWKNIEGRAAIWIAPFRMEGSQGVQNPMETILSFLLLSVKEEEEEDNVSVTSQYSHHNIFADRRRQLDSLPSSTNGAANPDKFTSNTTLECNGCSFRDSGKESQNFVLIENYDSTAFGVPSYSSSIQQQQQQQYAQVGHSHSTVILRDVVVDNIFGSMLFNILRQSTLQIYGATLRNIYVHLAYARAQFQSVMDLNRVHVQIPDNTAMTSNESANSTIPAMPLVSFLLAHESNGILRHSHLEITHFDEDSMTSRHPSTHLPPLGALQSSQWTMESTCFTIVRQMSTTTPEIMKPLFWLDASSELVRKQSFVSWMATSPNTDTNVDDDKSQFQTDRSSNLYQDFLLPPTVTRMNEDLETSTTLQAVMPTEREQLDTTLAVNQANENTCVIWMLEEDGPTNVESCLETKTCHGNCLTLPKIDVCPAIPATAPNEEGERNIGTEPSSASSLAAWTFVGLIVLNLIFTE